MSTKTFGVTMEPSIIKGKKMSSVLLEIGLKRLRSKFFDLYEHGLKATR
jgi:hypothetical protein